MSINNNILLFRAETGLTQVRIPLQTCEFKSARLYLAFRSSFWYL